MKNCVLSKMIELYPEDITVKWDDANLPEYNNRIKMFNMMQDFKLFQVEKNYLIELPDDEPEKDCMVAYFNDNELIHVGIVDEAKGDDSIVRSRWKNYNAVIKHKLWCVPTDYGTKVKFYKPLTFERAQDYLCEFLILHGVC